MAFWMFDSIFDHLFPLLFSLVFGLVLILFVVTLVRNLNQWNRNNHAPKLTVDAKIVAKRTRVSHHDSPGPTPDKPHHVHTSTSYYITFEAESGDRMEFTVSGSEYGLLVEGDTGRLTFQGTRYLDFVR